MSREQTTGTPQEGTGGRLSHLRPASEALRVQAPADAADGRSAARDVSQQAEEQLARVLAELDRLDVLPAVASDSGRANAFDTGARWTIRMVREALGGDDHAAQAVAPTGVRLGLVPPVGEGL